MTTISDVPNPIEQILHSAGIKPRGVQKKAIKAGIYDGKSIMVSSPTGSGKTLIGEMALLRAVLSGKKGLYLVPLRALAVQVASVLKERYFDSEISVGLSTGDYHTDGEELSTYDVIVTTYERTDSLLRKKTSWLGEIGTVVIDEIQTLAETQRGARLESTIIRLKHLIPEIQLIVLSATIGAPDELAEWLRCELVVSNDRPIPLHSNIITTSDKSNAVKEIVMTTVQSNGQCLVFHRTRREAEVQAIRLSADVGRQFTAEEKKKIDDELGSVVNWDVKLPAGLKALLHDGTAYHHAGLNYLARRLVEDLFRRGMIRVICATTTLASGIDLPARTVVLTSVKEPSNHNQFMSGNKIHQMLGRAGRPGYDKRGVGVLLAGSSGEADVIRRKYFKTSSVTENKSEILQPKYDRLFSTLNETNAVTEQLLVGFDMFGSTTVENIEQSLFSDSFLMYCSIRDTRSPHRILQLDELSSETAIERHALQDAIRSARQNVLASVKIRESTDSVIGGIVTGWEGGNFTSRFSAKLSPDGTVEGPMCSCGIPFDSNGLLCPHLVALGFTASKELGTLADYVIPLALSESNPLGVLTRLGLIEGSEDGEYRITHLGSVVNRLYLSIPTIREMIALLPFTSDVEDLLWLLRHLASIETGSSLDDSYENLVAGVASTDMEISKLAESLELHVGDAYGLLETSRWLLSAISAVSEIGGFEELVQKSTNLLKSLDNRLGRTTPENQEDEE
ncbi:MAG: putative ski2-type helicase [Candidatus Thorarchaeota archaeon]|nr:MAG: putative ski2-type helicase [Candidatus Thorarchaeota archaeon]